MLFRQSQRRNTALEGIRETARMGDQWEEEGKRCWTLYTILSDEARGSLDASNTTIKQIQAMLTDLFLHPSRPLTTLSTMKVELCAFSGNKIYPGKGRLYVRSDNRVSVNYADNDYRPFSR